MAFTSTHILGSAHVVGGLGDFPPVLGCTRGGFVPLSFPLPVPDPPWPTQPLARSDVNHGIRPVWDEPRTLSSAAMMMTDNSRNLLVVLALLVTVSAAANPVFEVAAPFETVNEGDAALSLCVNVTAGLPSNYFQRSFFFFFFFFFFFLPAIFF